MSQSGITDMSGLHWNPQNNRLYGVQGDGRLRVLQMNASGTAFSQIASKVLADGPEGITQADLAANTFYVIDENNYEIRKYNHTANFSSVTFSKSWNLLEAPSPMEDTGNTGPEGIVFVPDAALAGIGFISQLTGQPYVSVKGMGGLMFIAHQDEGYIWVFDINPNTSNNFAYVGKYQANRAESCDLAFDRSTGLLYILHNIADGNTLEVTDLSTEINGSQRKFISINEYFLPVADDNENIEGFAITPKCPETGSTSVWLCRDVENNEDDAVLEDALRWFSPFASDGSCDLNVHNVAANTLNVYPNPANSFITIGFSSAIESFIISNDLGQIIITGQNAPAEEMSIDVSKLQSGIYFLEVSVGGISHKTKFLKQ